MIIQGIVRIVRGKQSHKGNGEELDFCIIRIPYHLSKMTNAVSTEIQHAQNNENNTKENTDLSAGQFNQQ